MKKILSNRKAEGYIDIAVGIIALMMVLVVTLNIYTFFMLRQDLDTVSGFLIETATSERRDVPFVAHIPVRASMLLMNGVTLAMIFQSVPSIQNRKTRINIVTIVPRKSVTAQRVLA